VKIVKTSKYVDSFRNQSVIGQYDLDFVNNEIKEEWNVELPTQWKLGVIVGNSGTGKTTLAKEIFNYVDVIKEKLGNESILDLFEKTTSLKEITHILTLVGFASPKSWLKPYKVLSNGEKMRVDLALALLSAKKMIVFDEFTSVVDRNVAITMCQVINKILPKIDKQLLLISCHEDVLYYLDTDWIYDTNVMELTLEKKKRQTRQLYIYQAERSFWRMFSKFHYLDSSLLKTAACYVAILDNIIVGFCAVIHFPHPSSKMMKRIHRIVVLPDYQGIGIGKLLLNTVCQKYKIEKFKMFLTTSNFAMVKALYNSQNWILKRKGHMIPSTTTMIGMAQSKNKYTYSFTYV